MALDRLNGLRSGSLVNLVPCGGLHLHEIRIHCVEVEVRGGNLPQRICVARRLPRAMFK